MFNVTCSACLEEGKNVSQAVRVDGKVLCKECLPSIHPGLNVSDVSVVALDDAHWCLLCSAHSPERPHRVYDGTPICANCITKDLSKPFPLWVKAFFAGVLVLVLFSVAWNWRFFTAHRALNALKTDLEQGDLAGVVRNSTAAHEALPEDRDLASANTYYQAIQLLGQDSSRAALALFDKVAAEAPGMFDMGAFVNSARLGAAFDERDFDAFLLYAKRAMKMSGSDASTVGGLASAYACKFAVTGDSAYADSSSQAMDKAREMAGGDTTWPEYEERIRYRLATREIITRTEFHERYPNGWHN